MFRRLSLRGRSSASILITSALLLSLIACKPPPDRTSGGSAGGLVVSAAFTEAPALGPAPLVVTLDDAGEPVTGATVEVAGDMTHAGMQPVLRTAVESEPGRYRADDFAFTMAGDWIITLTATTADGRRVVGELFTNVPPR